MANRLVGNVIIVDSAMGNAFILNSGNMPVHFSKLHVNSIMFWSSDTTGRLQLTQTNTADVIFSLGWVTNGAGAGFSEATQSSQFGQQQPMEDLKVPVLTAGTAWIYLA